MQAPKQSILVIDDDPRLLELLQRVLRLHGSDWEVTGASNGREALGFVRERAFDLVITDIHMPDKDGLETIREVRRAQPSAKIMAMSGGGPWQGCDFLRIAQVLGAHAVIEKPFELEKLVATIGNLLATTADGDRVTERA